MIMAFAGICAFVWLFCSASDGEWGTFLIGAVIIVLVIGMAAGDRKDVKAWYNMRDYWADGGPDRDRRRR